MEAHGLFTGKGTIEIVNALVMSQVSLLLFEYLLLFLGKLLDLVLWTLLPSLGLALFVFDEAQARDVLQQLGRVSSLDALQQCVVSHRRFFLNAVLYIVLPLRVLQLISSVVLHRQGIGSVVRVRGGGIGSVGPRAGKKPHEADQAEDHDVARIAKALESAPSTSSSGNNIRRAKSPGSMTHDEVFGVRDKNRCAEDRALPVLPPVDASLRRRGVVRIGCGAQDKGGAGRYSRMDMATTGVALVNKSS